MTHESPSNTPADRGDAVLRKIAEAIVRSVVPATASGQTVFVPRYQIDALRDALSHPGETPASDGREAEYATDPMWGPSYLQSAAPKPATETGSTGADDLTVTLDDDARYRIARALCDASAARCGNYDDDVWKLYSGDFYEDADTVIEALASPTQDAAHGDRG